MKTLKQQTNLFLTLITILLFASCSNDDESIPASNQQFANVGLSFNQDNPSQTAKTVNRGTIYAWINSINVKATNGSYSTQTLFDLVNTGGESNSFVIDNVLLGNNTFVATTTTNTPQKLEVSTFPTSIATMTKLTELNNLSPYATYSGNITSDISVNNANALPTINLTTQQGRTIGIFALSQDLINNNYYAKINVTIDGIKQPEQIANKDNNVSLYWSDANSTNNKEIKIDIIVFDNKNVQYSIMKQISNLVTASSSNNTIYTIKDSSITVNSASTTSKFSFQVWNTNNSNIDTAIDTAIPSFSRTYNYVDYLDQTTPANNKLNNPKSTQVNYTHNYNLIGTTYYHFMYFTNLADNKMATYSGMTEIGNNMVQDTHGNIITVTSTNITVYNTNDNTKVIYHN